MIPLYHDFTGERVLILGGGAVGARKARRFTQEAETVVMSPRFADEDFGDATLVRAAPARSTVETWIDRIDPVLVVTATDDEAVNDAAARAAGERGLLVNRANRTRGRSRDRSTPAEADDATAHEVVVPATVRDGPVQVAIATGGRSPALSASLRERVESVVDGAGAVASAAATLHDELHASNVPADRRRAILTDFVRDSTVWTALRAATTNDDRVIGDRLAAALEDDDREDGRAARRLREADRRERTGGRRDETEDRTNGGAGQ